MKKIFLIAGLLSLIVLFGLPGNASAGVTTTENFDSYSANTTLDGANSGSNWTNSWTVLNGGLWTSNTAPLNGQGGLAMNSTSTAGSSSLISRSITPISSGTLHLKFKFSNDVQGQVYNILLDDSQNTGGMTNNHRIDIELNDLAGSSVDAGNGQSSIVQIGTFSTSTWNTLDIKFDNTLGNVFQVSVNGGAYSQNLNSGGSLANVDTLIFLNQTTSPHDFWVDDISITDNSIIPASIITGSGTSNRIAKFIGNSVIGNALFSDDGINTTLTSGNLLLTSGSIGIGTTSPSTKLFVNGDLFADWIKVAASGFGLDTMTSGTLFIGSTTASSIKIGRPNIITTIFGTTTTSNLLASTATISGKLSAGITTLGNTTLDTLNANSVISSGSLSASNITTGTLTATTSAYIAGLLTASSVNIYGSVTANSAAIITSNTGTTTVSSLKTFSNCLSSASPAVCASAPSGSVAMATGGSTLVVNTTAVGANSQIMITEDSSLGARLGITCNTTTTRDYRISARTAGSSFTIKSSANPATNKACLSYWIIN